MHGANHFPVNQRTLAKMQQAIDQTSFLRQAERRLGRTIWANGQYWTPEEFLMLEPVQKALQSGQPSSPSQSPHAPSREPSTREE